MTDAVEETTEGTEVAVEMRTDETGRKILTGAFSFKVPEGHPEQGNKIDKTFDYIECIDDRQAVAMLDERKWKLRELINDKLKASARSNSYQNALMPYRPSEVSQADIRSRLIRDLVRSGVPETIAITTINAALEAQAQRAQRASAAE